MPFQSLEDRQWAMLHRKSSTLILIRPAYVQMAKTVMQNVDPIHSWHILSDEQDFLDIAINGRKSLKTPLPHPLGLFIVDWDSLVIDPIDTLTTLKKRADISHLPVVVMIRSSVSDAKIIDIYAVGVASVVVALDDPEEFQDVFTTLIQYWWSVVLLPTEDL